MTVLQKRLTPTGEIVSQDTRFASLTDAVAEEPELGVYLVSNTMNGGKVFMLDAHFDRLERSAAALGVTVTVPRVQLRKILQSMLAEAGFGDGRFRISVAADTPGVFLVSMEKFTGLPAELLNQGIVCRTGRKGERNDPSVKSTHWLHARRELTGDDVFEYLLCDDEDRILEGTSSNFFAVVRGVLRTAGAGVLSGITRKAILELANDVLPVEQVAIPCAELGSVSEAFITSSTRGVVPVRRIDSVEIGTPGPVTRDLEARFRHWQQEHLEPLQRFGY